MYTPLKTNSFRRDMGKTDAYLDESGKLDARFCVKGFQELVGENAAATAVQLKSVRIVLAVIAYRKWNFRVMGVCRDFLRSEPLERGAYAKLPEGVEQGVRPGNY